MYFEDLTEYPNCSITNPPNKKLFYIGWLCSEHPFTKGKTSDLLVKNLEKLQTKPVMLMRGWHNCPFCPAKPFKEIPKERLGNGEIRVPGEGNVVYCAPKLVVHYIKEHQYKPPTCFIEAVETCDPIKLMNNLQEVIVSYEG